MKAISRRLATVPYSTPGPNGFGKKPRSIGCASSSTHRCE